MKRNMKRNGYRNVCSDIEGVGTHVVYFIKIKWQMQLCVQWLDVNEEFA